MAAWTPFLICMGSAAGLLLGMWFDQRRIRRQGEIAERERILAVPLEKWIADAEEKQP